MINNELGITFDDADFSDLPFIVEVYNQTIASKMVTADTSPISTNSRIEWFKAHNPLTRPLWIIKCHNQKCGWVSLSNFYGRPAYDKTVEISLYIHKDFRNKKIGQFTLLSLEDYAKNNGIETILSFIFGHNLPSLSLFKKMNYQEWGFLPGIAVLDNIKRDLMIMGKTISSFNSME